MQEQGNNYRETDADEGARCSFAPEPVVVWAKNAVNREFTVGMDQVEDVAGVTNEHKAGPAGVPTSLREQAYGGDEEERRDAEGDNSR